MNLREICKERIIGDMVRSVVPQGSSSWKALIVDHDSMRIISACCRMYDIMEENVTSMLLNTSIAIINTKRDNNANTKELYKGDIYKITSKNNNDPSYS